MPAILNKLITFILRDKLSTQKTENLIPEPDELSAEKLHVFLKFYRG